MSEAVATQPHASVLKFADYCTAHPGERNRIISRQKNPSDFIPARYTMAENAITAFLDGRIDAARLLGRRNTILNRPITTPSQPQRNALCAEAIDAALAFIPTSPLSTLPLTLIEPHPPRLVHNGVSISVQPDLRITCPSTRRDPSSYGLFKLRFGKTDPMSPEAARIAAAILLRYGTDFFPAEPPINYRFCWIYDVFHGVIHAASDRIVRTWSTISAACFEYATMWDAI